MIDFQGDIKNSKECIFYPYTDKQQEFHPFNIYGYRFDGGKYYVPKYFEENGIVKSIFAEYLVRGKKDLFYFREFRGNHFLISKNYSTLIIVPYKEEIVTPEGNSYIHESTTHIGSLKAYFSDCPSIFNDIENIGEPDMRKMIAITKKYNDEVCGENSCTIYKKNKLAVKFAVEARVELT